MEAIVFQDSPLAEYLEGEGGNVSEWADAESKGNDDSIPSSPSFAPRGKPTARLKFRQSLPPPLRLNIPQNHTIAAIHNTCSRAVNSRLGRADNARFLEQFRYIIVASQLLSGTSYLGSSRDAPLPSPEAPQAGAFTLAGAAATATLAFAIAWLIHWTRGGVAKGRMLVLLGILGVLALVSYAYIRRQWLQYLRQRTLAETSEFVAKSQEFDVVATAALNLIQEVELVSRGYRLSTPLPPISRLEDRHQTRRCARLRKALRLCFADVIPRYCQACTALKPLTESLDLEKYYDIYDISDVDSEDALLGYSETEFEDIESLRTLKILAARFHTIRKIFLCCLLALDAHGGKPDFFRWGIALDEIHALSVVTTEAEERMRGILTEEESFPIPPTPKIPLTPRRERWRIQLRKLNSLSSGIRGLQAKLHVLKEESDRTLDHETEEFSEFGADLMSQYESIGVDLKALMQEWEDGKAALASNIDKNERRISSMSSMLSPAISLSGLTSVEEGTPLDALKALNGEPRSRSSMEFSSSEAEEVFEAIALPRQRSSLTREQRIAKMKVDRAKRETFRDRQEANTRMHDRSHFYLLTLALRTRQDGESKGNAPARFRISVWGKTAISSDKGSSFINREWPGVYQSLATEGRPGRRREPVRLTQRNQTKQQDELASNILSLQNPNSLGHRLKQTEWDQAWQTATNALELPNIPLDSGDYLKSLESQPPPHPPVLELALTRVLFPTRYFSDTVKTNNLMEWYTKQARHHFFTQVEPILNHMYGQISELDPGVMVPPVLQILQAAHLLYIRNLSTVCKVLERDSRGSSNAVILRFRGEMDSIVNNAVPESFMKAIKAVLQDLVTVILEEPVSPSLDHTAASSVEEASEIARARSELLHLVKMLVHAGLAGEKFQVVFAEIMDDAMKKYVSCEFKGKWLADGSDISTGSGRKLRVSDGTESVISSRRSAQSRNIMKLCDWVENKFSRLCVEVFNQVGKVEIAWTDVEKWKEAGIATLTALRINELFDIVGSWPSCSGAIDDLRTAVTTPLRRLQLTDSFIATLKERLLHPGTSTLEILQVYISMIWSFHALDSSKVLLDRVAYPLQEYLCTRDDTVRLIITGLLADTVDAEGKEVALGGDKLVELALLLQKGSEATGGQSNDDELDWHDMEWQPDPVDAGPGYKRTKSADVIGTMIRELGAQDVFIKEFQSIIGDTLLKHEGNFEKEIKVLELLKSRFGEGQLQSCEVMLKDIQDSARLNNAITKLQRINYKRHPSKEDIDPDDPLKPSLNTKVLSRLFWPQLNDEEYKIPAEISNLQARYENSFQTLKSARKLTWLHSLGQATVELELADRTVVEDVHTWQATAIWAFEGDESDTSPVQRSVQELVDELEMDENLVRSALHFWVGKLVLEEVSKDTFAVMETLTQEDLARSNAQGASNSTAMDEGGPDAAMITGNASVQNEKMQIYWQFIQGMLTNSSPQMPLQQISMMLKMLIADGFPYGNEELQEFLGTKVEAGELEFVSGKYRLKK
ncbi:hypothetical protein B7463_g4336, partial [Scytalidium lignicola]